MAKSKKDFDLYDAEIDKEVEKMRFMTIKSGLRRGILPNSILYETKTLDLEDTKRQWSKQFNSNELQDSEPLLIMEHM